MKIVAISKEHSSATHTAYKTDPPITDEVLKCVFEHFGDDKGILSVSNRHLMSASALEPVQIRECEATLTQAEEFLAHQKTENVKRHEDDLEARAKKSGLPLT